MDGGDVGPVVVPDDVHQDLRLVVVGGNHPHEVREAGLVAQVPGGGRVSHLWDAEQLQQVLYLWGRETYGGVV